VLRLGIYIKFIIMNINQEKMKETFEGDESRLGTVVKNNSTDESPNVINSAQESTPLLSHKNSKNNRLIVSIFLCLIALIIVIFYFFVYRDNNLKKESARQKIINSSLESMKDVKTYASVTSASFNLIMNDEQSNISLDMIGIVDASDKDTQKSQYNTNLKIEMNRASESENYLIDFDSISWGKNNAYYKIDNLDFESFEAVTEEQLSMLKNKWYSLDSEVFRSMPGYLGSGSLIIENYDSNKILDILSKYEILKFEEDLGNKTIENVEVYHYKVKLDGMAIFSMYFDIMNETLGSARAKAMDMEAKINVAEVMTPLIIYYDDNNNSYEGFVLPEYSGLKPENIRTSKDSFVVWSELSSTTDKFCEDSDYNSGYVLGEIEGFACPDSMSRSPMGEKKDIDLSDIKKDMENNYSGAISEGFQDINMELWIGKEDGHIHRILIEGKLDKLIDEIVAKSLSSARAKAMDASVSANISSLIPRLIMYYDDNNNSYEGFVLSEYSNLKPENIRISKDAFVVWSEMNSTKDKFCYDSDMNSGYVLGEIEGFACPDSISRSPRGEKKDLSENDSLSSGMSFKFKIDISYQDFNRPLEIKKPENVEDLLEVIKSTFESPETIPDRINQDSDGDGLTDDMESMYGTDVNNPDTDGDGFSDGDEINGGYDPLVPGGAKLNIDDFLGM